MEPTNKQDRRETSYSLPYHDTEMIIQKKCSLLCYFMLTHEQVKFRVYRNMTKVVWACCCQNHCCVSFHQPLGPNVHYATYATSRLLCWWRTRVWATNTYTFSLGFGNIGFESRCVSNPKWNVMYLQLILNCVLAVLKTEKKHPRKKKMPTDWRRQRLRA